MKNFLIGGTIFAGALMVLATTPITSRSKKIDPAVNTSSTISYVNDTIPRPLPDTMRKYRRDSLKHPKDTMGRKWDTTRPKPDTLPPAKQR